MNSAARTDPFVPENLASGARRAHDVRVAESPLSPHQSDASRSWLTGPRVLALIAGWLVVAFVAAPSLGLYYEARASFYLLPPLVLVYGYCLSHPPSNDGCSRPHRHRGRGARHRPCLGAVSYTHLRAHETRHDLV